MQVALARLKMPRVAADAAVLCTPGAVRFAARSFADVAPAVAAEPLASRPRVVARVVQAAEPERTLQALHFQREAQLEALHVAAVLQAAHLPRAAALGLAGAAVVER